MCSLTRGLVGEIREQDQFAFLAHAWHVCGDLAEYERAWPFYLARRLLPNDDRISFREL